MFFSTDFNTNKLTETFSDFTTDSENLSPWVANVSIYNSSGVLDNGYTFAPPSNGPQVSQILTNQNTSNRFLNFYSNYDDADQNKKYRKRWYVYRKFVFGHIKSMLGHI